MRLRKHCVSASFASAIVLFSAPVAAQHRCQWVQTKGEAAVENVTAEEARQISVRAARAQAVEQVSGVELQAQTIVRNRVLAGEFLRSLAHGYILREEVIRWEQDSLQDAPDKPPVTLYRVHLRACVSPAGGMRDPYFTLTAELNKSTFVAGEEAALKVRCSRACHVTIFNLSADDRFSLLLPNSYQPAALLRPQEELVFPPPGLALRMEPVSDHRRDTEGFLVVATKQALDAHTRLGRREAIPIGEVFGMLLDVPASERAEVFLVYDVVRTR